MSGTIPSLSQYVLTQHGAAALCSEEAGWETQDGITLRSGFEAIVDEILANSQLSGAGAPVKSLMNRCDPRTVLSLFSAFFRQEFGPDAPYVLLALKEEGRLSKEEQGLFDGLNALLASEDNPEMPVPVMVSLLLGVPAAKIKEMHPEELKKLDKNECAKFFVDHGQGEALSTLVELGFDLLWEGSPWPIGRSTADYILRKGQPQMLRQVIQKLEESGNTPASSRLRDCFRNYDRKRVEEIIEGQQIESLRFLHEMGYQFERPNDSGHYFVHIAARSKNVEVLRFFQSIGMDLNRPDREGNSTVYHLAKSGKVETLRVFLEIYDDSTGQAVRAGLEEALQQGNQKAINTFLALGLVEEETLEKFYWNRLADEVLAEYESLVDQYPTEEPRVEEAQLGTYDALWNSLAQPLVADNSWAEEFVEMQQGSHGHEEDGG